MAFGKKGETIEVDDTAWILDNVFAEFVLMHTAEIVSIPMAVPLMRTIVQNSAPSHVLHSCSILEIHVHGRIHLHARMQDFQLL
jgi:hypothetical protein